MSHGLSGKLLTGMLATFFLLIIAGCTSHTAVEEKRGEKVDPQVFDKEAYVGSARCRDCHSREYDSWKHTLHSKFMQSAGDDSVLGDFERNNKLVSTVPEKAPELAGKTIATTMFKKDGKYYVSTLGPDWEIHDYEISHVIGINNRQHYLTTFPNGASHVLPVEWDIRQTKWVDNYGLARQYPGSGNFWSDDKRNWQFRCGGCHTTGMKINYNREMHSFNTIFADIGIGCEACHGPGRDHIAAARIYFEKEKDTIINPSKLQWRIRAAVCGQCHNRGASAVKVTPYREGFPERYSYPYGFEVGKPLYLYYIDEPLDGEKSYRQQYNEWSESAHAEAGVMCTTCHGVHQEGQHKNPNKALTKFISDTLCTNCHTTIRQKAAHRIHTFGSCIACHMPRTRESEHSHTFRFISPEESLRAGGVDKKPNSCSGCHHHKNTPLTALVEFLDAVKKEDMPVPFSVHGR